MENMPNGLPPRGSPILRLNTICPYFTMFPLSFPFEILEGATKDEWVLDPFCGRGTTLFAARLRGISSVGIDSSKVAIAISAAKFVSVRAEEIALLCNTIINGSGPVDVPEGPFWEACYHHDTLEQVVRIRNALLECCETDAEIALRALMLGILHGPQNARTPSYLSNQMPRTYSTKPDYSVRYWMDNNLRPQCIDIRDLVNRRARFVFSHIPKKCHGHAELGDSRKPFLFRPRDGYNWVITSPPYLGMTTYKQDQWLRDWFVGGSDKVDYTKSEQISRTSTGDFIDELAMVWKNVSQVCAPDAKLIIRLGMIPSFKGSAREIMHDSLEASNSGWMVKAIQPAGVPSRGSRQAEHFGVSIGRFSQEIDCFAELK